MANVCEYTMIVKGKKNACYAFMAGQSNFVQDIDNESGDENNFELMFSGECKWSVDQYAKSYDEECPVSIPDDPDEAASFSEEKLQGYTVQSRSMMFAVEVMCNSRDAEGEPEVAYYVHYRNGNPIGTRVPDELKFGCTTEQHNITLDIAGDAEAEEAFLKSGTFVTKKQNVFMRADKKLYLNQDISFAIRDGWNFSVKADEDGEEYLEVENVLSTCDEDDEVSLRFGFDYPEEATDELHTFYEGNDLKIEIACIQARGDFVDRFFGHAKCSAVTKICHNDKKYFVEAFTDGKLEANIATMMRLLEDVLESIMYAEKCDAFEISRVSNWMIHKVHEFMHPSSESDNSDDE